MTARQMVVASLVGALFAGCGGRGSDVTIHVRPAQSLIDQPVRVELAGLPSDRDVTLQASWRSFGGLMWRSSQPVHPGSDGTATVQGMRFLWNMRPQARGLRAFNAAFGVRATGVTRVRLAVVDRGRVFARSEFVRRATAPGVRVRMLTVRRQGLYALYFEPKPGRPRPAVVAIGGSEGGIGMVDEAAMLAAHGYPAMALGYFRGPSLPRDLRDVPLEYFARAARWIAAQPGVDRKRIVILGASRGGEAALIVASTFPRIFHGAIGLVPSAMVNGSFPEGGAAWTLHAKPLHPYTDIALDRINGPVLVAGAGHDQVSGSEVAVQQIGERLGSAHFHFRHEELDFPNAGHNVGFAGPYLPQPDPQRWGGTRRAGAAAAVVVWRHVLGFLARLQ